MKDLRAIFPHKFFTAFEPPRPPAALVAAAADRRFIDICYLHGERGTARGEELEDGRILRGDRLGQRADGQTFSRNSRGRRCGDSPVIIDWRDGLDNEDLAEQFPLGENEHCPGPI